MNLEKYRKIFFDETTAELNSIEGIILSMEKATPDAEAINSIFRLFHRLKSSSAMMGLNNFSELSHRSEDLLSLIKEDKITIEESVISALLSVIDTMRNLIREADGGNIEGFKPEELLARLKQICDRRDTEAAALGETPMPLRGTKEHENRREQEDTWVPDFFRFAQRKRCSLDRGLRLKPNTQQGFSGERDLTPQDKAINEVFPDVSAAQVHHGLNVIRIDEAEVNDLIDMAGELISTISGLERVGSLLNGISPGLITMKEIEAAGLSINSIRRKAEKLSLNIHTQLLRSKMVPVGEVFERLRRVVHDLSVRTNKCIQVAMNGGDIEMDRAIVDKLFNPLLHLVRNAVDHGVEGEEERQKNGKSPISTITLSASLEGHFVTISVEDDGRGIDLERVKREIVNRNILDERGVESFSEKEILDYLFMPGFSTKEEATDISGRGMGLDIVKENVRELKGNVGISTRMRGGTVVKITIPQTLSIIRCLQVFIGDEIYSIPSESIMEIIPYSPETLITFQGRPLLLHRGSPIPVADLQGILDIRFNAGTITASIIIGSADQRIAVPVSNIVGEQDILIKHLGHSFSTVKGILGAGILGGGRLSLIMDTDFLLRQYQPLTPASIEHKGA